MHICLNLFKNDKVEQNLLKRLNSTNQLLNDQLTL